MEQPASPFSAENCEKNNDDMYSEKSEFLFFRKTSVMIQCFNQDFTTEEAKVDEFFCWGVVVADCGGWAAIRLRYSDMKRKLKAGYSRVDVRAALGPANKSLQAFFFLEGSHCKLSHGVFVVQKIESRFARRTLRQIRE